MNYYIQKDGQQVGPFDEEATRTMLFDGRFSPNDMACREGDQNWSTLVSVLSSNPEETSVIDREFALYDIYSDEMSVLLDQMSEAESGGLKDLGRQFDQKLQIARKHVDSVRQQCPNAFELRVMDADVLFMMARYKVSQQGFLRSSADRMHNRGKRKRSLTSLSVAAATGMIAKQHEKNNALEAIALLDQSVSTFDTAGARLAKSIILKLLGQNNQALEELNYIITNFQSDDAYMPARQMKDEIENPPKKGMCFVATATFGSYDSPEVVYLSSFRDVVLKQSVLGRFVIRVYYLVGPYPAVIISKSWLLRLAVRQLFLNPLIRVLKRIL